MNSLIAVAVLLGTGAFAQGKPTVIDYPLDVKTAVTDGQLSELEDDFRLLLAKNSAVLFPTRSNWKASIAALKRQDCDIRDECLRQLAITAGTLYALYASLERDAAGTSLIATGRLVNQDGAQVRAPVKVAVLRRGKLDDDARDALSQLLSRLQLDKLSAVLTPVAAPEPKKAEVEKRVERPEVVLTPPPMPTAEPTPAPLRYVAWGTGGLAVVAAVTSIAFGASAASARGGLPNTGQFSDDGQGRTQASVNQGATVALATGIAAAVLGGASCALFVFTAPTASVAIAPTPGGGALAISGRF